MAINDSNEAAQIKWSLSWVIFATKSNKAVAVSSFLFSAIWLNSMRPIFAAPLLNFAYFSLHISLFDLWLLLFLILVVLTAVLLL